MWSTGLLAGPGNLGVIGTAARMEPPAPRAILLVAAAVVVAAVATAAGLPRVPAVPGLAWRLSRDVWQPEPPQSWPLWWFGPSRTHSLTPVLVLQVIPYSWQLSQAFSRTGAC